MRNFLLSVLVISTLYFPECLFVFSLLTLKIPKSFVYGIAEYVKVLSIQLFVTL